MKQPACLKSANSKAQVVHLCLFTLFCGMINISNINKLNMVCPGQNTVLLKYIQGEKTGDIDQHNHREAL